MWLGRGLGNAMGLSSDEVGELMGNLKTVNDLYRFQSSVIAAARAHGDHAPSTGGTSGGGLAETVGAAISWVGAVARQAISVSASSSFSAGLPGLDPCAAARAEQRKAELARDECRSACAELDCMDVCRGIHWREVGKWRRCMWDCIEELTGCHDLCDGPVEHAKEEVDKCEERNEVRNVWDSD